MPFIVNIKFKNGVSADFTNNSSHLRRLVMWKEKSFFKSISLAVFLFILTAWVGVTYAQKPILTDEFDSFLVTKQTKIGEVIGKIELIFPNPKKITWSLIPPIPGADPRHYLKEGQLDATKIVEINPDTGELRLKAHQ